MTRDDIIRMAREAGASSLLGGEVALFGDAAIERFAELVAAAEREKHEKEIERYRLSAAMWRNEAYKLGGTPLPWDADELIEKAVAREREACAKVCEQEALRWPSSKDFRLCAAAIRARGET